MKKIAIIGAVVGLAFAGVTSAATVYHSKDTKVEVYGYGKAAHAFSAQGAKNGVEKSEAQIGVKVKQQLNPQFALLGQYEGEYDVNDTGARHWHNRKAFGGVDAAEYGAVTVGRQQGLIYNVAGLTDVNPEVISGWSASADTGLLGRADSVVQYQNTLGDVTFTGQYKLGTTQSVETGQKVAQGAAYGASITAANVADTGLFGGVAYANQKATTAGAADSNVYSVGAGWAGRGVYVAATSTVGKNTAKAKSFYDNEVIGQYTFDNGVMPSLGYVDSNAGGSRAKFVETGLAYSFNPNVIADVGFGYDVTGKADHQTKVGLKYKF